MAQQTLNSNSVEPLGGPNLGLSTEQGDSWATAVSKINSMMNDLYGNSSSIAAANRRGPVIDLSTNVTAVSSGSTNTSQTLMSYALPPSTLAGTGQGIYVETWGNVANNAAAKSVALNIGGKVLSTGTFTSAASSWSLDGYYMKTGASAQTALFEGWAGSTRVASSTGTDTSVDTGTINVTVVVTDASAASNDVVVNGLLVEFLS